MKITVHLQEREYLIFSPIIFYAIFGFQQMDFF